MISSISDAAEKVMATLLLPATLYGAGGAFLHARRDRKPARQTLLEVAGGAFAANMLCPIAQKYAPVDWHYTLFFLIGWGGLEAVGRAYEALASAAEKRISKKVGGDDV